MSKAARSESGRRKGCRRGLVGPRGETGCPRTKRKDADRGDPHPRSSLALAAQGGATLE
jgi:hypothetical protein